MRLHEKGVIEHGTTEDNKKTVTGIIRLFKDPPLGSVK